MEKITLKDFVMSNKKQKGGLGEFIRLDDGELRTAEEWKIFFEEKLGEKEFSHIFVS